MKTKSPERIKPGFGTALGISRPKSRRKRRLASKRRCGASLTPQGFSPLPHIAKIPIPCWVSGFLVRRKGFEPLTFWFVAKHSIQLS